MCTYSDVKLGFKLIRNCLPNVKCRRLVENLFKLVQFLENDKGAITRNVIMPVKVTVKVCTLFGRSPDRIPSRHPTAATSVACRECDWLPCWPLYSQQMLHQRWIWGLAHKQESMQARNPPWLWNPGQTSPEVRNRGISGPTKRTRVLQKFKKKEKKFNILSQHWGSRSHNCTSSLGCLRPKIVWSLPEMWDDPDQFLGNGFLF